MTHTYLTYLSSLGSVPHRTLPYLALSIQPFNLFLPGRYYLFLP